VLRATVVVVVVTLSTTLVGFGSANQLEGAQADCVPTKAGANIWHSLQRRAIDRRNESLGNLYAQIVDASCGPGNDGARCSCGPTCVGVCAHSDCQPPARTQHGPVSFGTDCQFKNENDPCTLSNGHQGKCNSELKCM
jgi:hypothetical protein